MALYTFNFVFHLSSFHLHTGSFNTPIILAAFPILLLISSSILPSLLVQILHYLNCMTPTSCPQLPHGNVLSLSPPSLLLQFTFISHIVSASYIYFKFICRDSSLSATKTISSAKSKTSTFSFYSLTPSLKPSLASFTILSRNTLNSHSERVLM